MVNSFYADPALGGDGSTTDDSTSSTTGLDNGGHRQRLVPMFSQMIAILNFCKNLISGYATTAQNAANTAVNAPGTSGTSTTSDTIATGSTTVTTQTGKAWAIGQWVIFASTASPNNFMIGQITAYNSGTGSLTVNVPTGGAFGAGTFTAWTISLTAPLDSTIAGRVSALETEATRQKGRRRLFYKELL